MKHEARDDIPARIVSIERGGVMCEVDVQLECTGDRAHVLAKAVNVLLTKE